MDHVTNKSMNSDMYGLSRNLATRDQLYTTVGAIKQRNLLEPAESNLVWGKSMKLYRCRIDSMESGVSNTDGFLIIGRRGRFSFH